MVFFDKAYSYSHQFAVWTSNSVYFVTQQKKNALYTVVEALQEQSQIKGKSMVLKEEIIELEYFPEDKDGKRQTMVKATLQLKKVCYLDEKNRYYEFLSNSMERIAEEIVFLYKKRWGIENLFKKMKQNFQLYYFYGKNENAIRTQVWCTFIAQLLMTVIQKMAQTKKPSP